MKKRKIILILWVLVLAVAAMIFAFSAQEGKNSSEVSAAIAKWLIHIIHPDYDDWPAAERSALFDTYHFIVRKTAHYSEFALLGALVRLLIEALEWKRLPWLLSWLAVTLYAVTDEVHQVFVDSRAGMWQDVCIDSAGALTAILLTSLVLALIKKKSEKKKAEPA